MERRRRVGRHRRSVRLTPREVLRKLWRRRRLLMIGAGVALLLALFFAARVLVHLALWEARRDEPLAAWMTVGYVAHAYRVDREPLALAVGLDPELRQRLTLAQIAAQRQVPLDEIEAELRAAIAEQRGESPEQGEP